MTMAPHSNSGSYFMKQQRYTRSLPVVADAALASG